MACTQCGSKGPRHKKGCPKGGAAEPRTASLKKSGGGKPQPAPARASAAHPVDIELRVRVQIIVETIHLK